MWLEKGAEVRQGMHFLSSEESVSYIASHGFPRVPLSTRFSNCTDDKQSGGNISLVHHWESLPRGS